MYWIFLFAKFCGSSDNIKYIVYIFCAQNLIDLFCLQNYTEIFIFTNILTVYKYWYFCSIPLLGFIKSPLNHIFVCCVCFSPQVYFSRRISASAQAAAQETSGAGAEIDIWERSHYPEQKHSGRQDHVEPQKSHHKVGNLLCLIHHCWKESLTMNHFCLCVFFQLLGSRATAMHANPTAKTFGVEDGCSVHPQTTVTVNTQQMIRISLEWKAG